MASRIFDYIWLGLLAAISIIDIKKRIVPDALLVFGALICLLQWLFGQAPFLDGVIGAAAGFVLFLLTRLIGSRLTGKEALGWGDVKLVAVAGGYLGVYRLLVALLLGTLFGALLAIAFIAFSKLDRHDELPFAPALCFGIGIATFFGHEIIAWYLGLLM